MIGGWFFCAAGTDPCRRNKRWLRGGLFRRRKRKASARKGFHHKISPIIIGKNREKRETEPPRRSGKKREAQRRSPRRGKNFAPRGEGQPRFPFGCGSGRTRAAFRANRREEAAEKAFRKGKAAPGQKPFLRFCGAMSAAGLSRAQKADRKARHTRRPDKTINLSLVPPARSSCAGARRLPSSEKKTALSSGLF